MAIDTAIVPSRMRIAVNIFKQKPSFGERMKIMVEIIRKNTDNPTEAIM